MFIDLWGDIVNVDAITYITFNQGPKIVTVHMVYEDEIEQSFESLKSLFEEKDCLRNVLPEFFRFDNVDMFVNPRHCARIRSGTTGVTPKCEGFTLKYVRLPYSQDHSWYCEKHDQFYPNKHKNPHLTVHM